ncbi:MAG TPA: beta-galactosidase, partial [Verrucomicrobiae bacterium]|nr:beta-galactosidase [Verrucomicrobiae bacterium]
MKRATIAAAAGLLAAMLCCRAAHAAQAGWSGWNAARVASDGAYPVFEVDGAPFFVYGAAFFYERVPRARWETTLLAYRAMGINTIDLYVIWNWHEPEPGVVDFTGRTDPRRDLLGLLAIVHRLGLKVILRPGPVIRNE